MVMVIKGHLLGGVGSGGYGGSGYGSGGFDNGSHYGSGSASEDYPGPGLGNYGSSINIMPPSSGGGYPDASNYGVSLAVQKSISFFIPFHFKSLVMTRSTVKKLKEPLEEPERVMHRLRRAAIRQQPNDSLAIAGRNLFDDEASTSAKSSLKPTPPQEPSGAFIS
nr:UBP1-associated protein 2C-like [Tanacetum cinerariifolium]